MLCCGELVLIRHGHGEYCAPWPWSSVPPPSFRLGGKSLSRPDFFSVLFSSFFSFFFLRHTWAEHLHGTGFWHQADWEFTGEDSNSQQRKPLCTCFPHLSFRTYPAPTLGGKKAPFKFRTYLGGEMANKTFIAEHLGGICRSYQGCLVSYYYLDPYLFSA